MSYTNNLGSQRLIALFLFIFLFHYSSFSFAKSYSNPSATVAYTLNPDGSISVHEEIIYDIQCSSSDCYHELYIWHPTSLKITSPSGHCIGTDCRFFTQYNQGNYELVLRNDNGFKTGTYTAVFDYTLEGEILEQKDTAQFFYKIWYDQWPQQIGTLSAYVTIPGFVSDTFYFIHPSSSRITYSNTSKTISITSSNHPANQYLEINLLMPKEWFTNLRKAPNYMTKEEIIKGETGAIHENFLFFLILEIIIPLLFILFPILIFFYLYFVYGREEEFPEIKTLPPYIRDISEIGDVSPAEAALLFNPISSARDIRQTANIISAEMLELVRLGFLRVEEVEAKQLIGTSKKIYFIPERDKDTSKLTQIQKDILGFITSNLEDGKFSFEREFKFNYDHFSDQAIFTNSLRAFVNNLYVQCLRLLKEKQYLDMTGMNIMNYVFGIWTIVAMLLFFFAFLSPSLFFAFFFIFIYAFGIAILNSRPDILGKWSKEGRIKHEKMLRYKKFMEELTLMKDKAPQDIILWEKMLVYATALGVADKVVDAMKVVVPDYNTNARLRSFSTVAIALPKSSINTISTYTGRSRGGFGGGHGGGGGGGGAR